MASALSSTQTSKSSPLSVVKDHVYTMVAAFTGVVFGVLGSLGFVGTYLHSEFAAENTALSHQLVNVAPTSDVTSACVAPAGSGSSTNKAKAVTAAKVAPAGSTWTAPAAGNQGNGGMGGGGYTLPFVNQMVSGTISDTGPHSTNSITTTNTNTTKITNTNDVNVSNVNLQSANSGSATVKDNTNAGSAQSGTASNEHNSNTSVSIDN